MAPVLAILAALLGSGCLTVSTLETARVLKPDENRFLVGGGTAGGIGTGRFALPTQPNLEVGYRRGVREGYDVGIRASPYGAYIFDAKLALLDDEKLAVAMGLAVAYLTPWTDGARLTMVDPSVPLFVSYDLLDWLAAYGVARAVAQFRTWAGHPTELDWLLISALGLKFGRTSGFIAEATFGHTFSSIPGDFAQWSGALFFAF